MAVSLYCAVCFALAAIDGKMGWVCNSDSASPEVARVLMFFYFSKFFEFFDTIIMALRKKNDQISFLHVYHHISSWFFFSFFFFFFFFSYPFLPWCSLLFLLVVVPLLGGR